MMRERRPTLNDRREARRIAWRVQIDSRGSREMAKALAPEYAEDYGVSPSMIIFMVRLILWWIDFWYSAGIVEPSREWAADEPAIGSEGGDDADETVLGSYEGEA